MAIFDFIRSASPDEARQDLAARHAVRQSRATDKDALPNRQAHPDPLSISATYFKLRRGLWILGGAFPIVLVLGGGVTEIQHSLSAYYHYAGSGSTAFGAGSMRNIFVGILCAVGVLLVLYRGYSMKEDIALDVAGVAAFAIALLPMDWPENDDAAQTLRSKLHFTSAAIFFVMIAYVCVFRAKDTLNILRDEKTRARLKRCYRRLGAAMVLMPIFVLLVHAPHALFGATSPNQTKWGFAVILVEVIGVWVFSIFWFVKSYEIGLIENE